MKVTHSLILSLVASTIVGVAIATVNQPAHQFASEVQSTAIAAPIPTPSSLITSPLTISGMFMVRGNQIARIDVVRNSTIKTLNGAGIGDTRAKIQETYPRLIKVTPHKYVQGGHYLTYTPPKASDRKYSIVFETNENDVVTRFRSGKLPEVTWVEGCF